jgi:hypothetical protein
MQGLVPNMIGKTISDLAVDAAGSTIATVQRDLRTSIDVLDPSGASLARIEAEEPVTGVAWIDDDRVVYSLAGWVGGLR